MNADFPLMHWRRRRMAKDRLAATSALSSSSNSCQWRSQKCQ